MRGHAPKRSGKFQIGPNFTPVALSQEDLNAVDKIIRAVDRKLDLSHEDKARLWGALLASKRSIQKFSYINRYRRSSADLKVLQKIKARSGEVANLLQDYTRNKSLAIPDSRMDGLSFYMAVLREIQAVAQRTATREKTYAGLQPPETLQELYVGSLLATIFEEIFKREATATIVPATDKPGPFIRFIQLAHAKLGLPVPPAASIRTWRRRYQKKKKN